MITDDRFPENMSEEEIDKLHRRARWGAPVLIGAGGITYIANKIAGSKGRKKTYKRLNRAGLAGALGGAGLIGTTEYLHYKYKKNLKNDNKKKKD